MLNISDWYKDRMYSAKFSFTQLTIIRSVFPPARWTIRKAIVVFNSTEGGQADRLTKARINGSRV